MKAVTLSLFMILTLLVPATMSRSEEVPAADSLPVPAAESACTTDYGEYGRVATALLQIADGEPTRSGGSFLGYLDQPTAVRIVAGAFESRFTEEESRQIADFLATPQGQEGIGIFSRWLLRGEFLKNPVPQELSCSWETFRATSSGIKLFAEAFSLYKQISVEAVKIGGTLVAKAITSDVGKKAAVGILGALMKSGAFF